MSSRSLRGAARGTQSRVANPSDDITDTLVIEDSPGGYNTTCESPHLLPSSSAGEITDRCHSRHSTASASSPTQELHDVQPEEHPECSD